MPTFKTSLDRIEADSEGNVFVKLQKQVLGDDAAVVLSQPHRTSIPPDVDPDAQISVVNEHLASMGFPAVSAENLATIKSFVETARASL